MASELFTVWGVVPNDTQGTLPGTGPISGECFVLNSDVWSNPTRNLYSGSVYTIRLPRGTKMKVWDSKVMDPTQQGFTVNIMVFDDMSGIITGSQSGVFVSGWTVVGQDTVASGCCTYHAEQDARPQHLIESPDGNKYVAFAYPVGGPYGTPAWYDANGGDGVGAIQYTIEITDEVQG